jgi:hypothetical protein
MVFLASFLQASKQNNSQPPNGRNSNLSPVLRLR